MIWIATNISFLKLFRIIGFWGRGLVQFIEVNQKRKKWKARKRRRRRKERSNHPLSSKRLMLSLRNNFKNTKEIRKSSWWAMRSLKENWSSRKSMEHQIFPIIWLFKNVIIFRLFLMSVKPHTWRPRVLLESSLKRYKVWERIVDLKLKIRFLFSMNLKMKTPDIWSKFWLIWRIKYRNWSECQLNRNLSTMHLLMRNWLYNKNLSRRGLNLQFRFICKRLQWSELKNKV